MSLKPGMTRAQHTRVATSASLAGSLVNHPTYGDGHPGLHSSSAPITVCANDDPRATPPKHNNRTLILCFDGTAEEFNTTNSNVVQFVSLLKKNDCSQQVVYYQSGIGSYETTQMSSKLSSKIWKLLDFMFALDLNAHVMSGYEFLMQSYTPGDKICLFGFSRGAHTARSLAGMIQKVGLLTPNNVQQISFAYKMYNQCDDTGWTQSTAFKKAFCLDVDSIEFIGVWDTVASVGLLPRKLPFASSPTAIRTFRHALSLDERRVNFKATPWNRPTEEEANLGVDSPKNFMAKAKAHLDDEASSDDEDNKHEFPSAQEEQDDQCRTDVKEVWFAGGHCDVGGGSVSNDTRNSLARIPLRWMIRECFRTNTGIMFDTQGLREIGLDPSKLYPLVAPRPPAIWPVNAHIREIPQKPESPSWIRRFISRLVEGKSPDSLPNTTIVDENMADASVGTEEMEDLKDALSPLYDELELMPAWWIPEFLPIKVRYQREDNSWISYFTFNRGRPRIIPAQERGVNIHRSVQIRKEASYRSGKKYQPRPTITAAPTWVD